MDQFFLKLGAIFNVEFVSEHRNVIYTIALVVLADHFLFDGKFREKLKGLVDKMLCKAEKQLDSNK